MEPKEYDIEFVRGDTCPFTFTAKDGDGNPLDIDDLTNFNMYFTVKNNYNEQNAIIQKTYLGGTIVKDGTSFKLIILPEDTENLNYGRYVYDVSIKSQDFKATILRGEVNLTHEVTFAVNE